MAIIFGINMSSQAQSATISFSTDTLNHSVSKNIQSRSDIPKISPKTPPKSTQKSAKYLISIALISIIFTLLSATSAHADYLTAPSFNIHMSTVNIGGGQLRSPSFDLNTTIGQTAQGLFGTTGYLIKAGFQYIHPFTPFSFTISNLDVNFGTLVPNTFSSGSTILTVTTGSAYGYAVKTIADHALRLLSGSATIPNTSCDSALPCTALDATPWIDTTRYGFGYNMAGTDVDAADFVDSSYYRPFPIQGVDSPVTVMSRSKVATQSSATATYKVNVSGAQTAGTYQNYIQYIAIPSF